MNIPETGKESHEERGKIMGSGMHIAKISSIEPTTYTDRRGYPSLKVTFRNKKGETISKNFYYSDKAADHPSRFDEKIQGDQQ